MFARAEFNQPAQRLVCMMLAAVMVAALSAVSAYSIHLATHAGYSVSVTQLR